MLSIFSLANGKFTNNLACPSAVANCKKRRYEIRKELWSCGAFQLRSMSYKRKQHEMRQQEHGQVILAQSNATATSVVPIPVSHAFSILRQTVVFSTCKNLLKFCVRIITWQARRRRLKHKSVANRQPTHQSWSRILVWLCVILPSLLPSLFWFMLHWDQILSIT